MEPFLTSLTQMETHMTGVSNYLVQGDCPDSLDNIDFDLIETNLRNSEEKANNEAAELSADGDCDGCKI